MCSGPGFLTSVVYQSKIVVKMHVNKWKYFKTALRFHGARKAVLQQAMLNHAKGFYKIHRSKSMNRKFVTGGPKLKSSGEYTMKFCEAVLHLWEEAQASGDGGFAHIPILWKKPYQQLWKEVLATNSVDKDSWFENKTPIWQIVFQMFVFQQRVVAINLGSHVRTGGD